MKRYFLELFILTIISAAAGIPAAMALATDGIHSAGAVFLKLFAFAYSLLILAPLDYGVLFGFVRGARGEVPQVNDIFAVLDNYLHVILTRLVTSVIVGIGMVALIVPGIYFACRLAFAPYLVVEYKLEVVQALRASWDRTRGKAGTIFLMGLSTIPIGLVGLLMCGVGILFAMVWIRGAFASLYVALTPAPAPTGEQDDENGNEDGDAGPRSMMPPPAPPASTPQVDEPEGNADSNSDEPEDDGDGAPEEDESSQPDPDKPKRKGKRQKPEA